MLDKDFLSEILMPYFEGFQKSLRTILDNLNTFQTNSECFFSSRTEILCKLLAIRVHVN